MATKDVVEKPTKAQILAQWMILLRDVNALSDGELIDAILEEVTVEMRVVSREYILLTALLDRFQIAIDLEARGFIMETKTKPTPVCTAHCGHDPRWVVEGVCCKLTGPYLDPNGECGHRCQTAAAVHQVAPQVCLQCESNARDNESGGYHKLAEECRAYCRRGHKPAPPDQHVAPPRIWIDGNDTRDCEFYEQPFEGGTEYRPIAPIIEALEACKAEAMIIGSQELSYRIRAEDWDALVASVKGKK